MATTVPTHIQRQFQSIIRLSNEKVGQDATIAYLKSFCTDASLDTLCRESGRSQSPLERQHTSATSQSEEDMWKTLTFLDDVTYDPSGLDIMTYTGTFSSPASYNLKENLPTVASLNEDIPNPINRLSVSNPETSFLSSSFPLSTENKPITLCQACICERCVKSKKQKETDNNNIPNKVIRFFLRPKLLELLSEYWETLKVNGLYYHESAQSFQWIIRDSPVHVRRLHYHLILDHLGIEDDLYQWRRSIAEINNLNGYNAFVAEAENQIKQSQRARRSGETNSQKAHKDYLAYIYADRAPKDPKKAKRAIKKNLEFGRRWSILVDGYVEGNIVVPGLGLGVLLLCGPYIKKTMFIFRAFWESRTNKNLVTIRERSNHI